MIKDEVDMLVVGAGPVGLFCANELNRHGLTCRIIEKKAHLSDKSKALGLHIRTLDLFADCGLLDAVLKQGLKVNGVTFKSHNRNLGKLDFTGIEANRHFLIDLPQDKTERILYDALVQKAIQVEWNSELVELLQSENNVSATIKHPDGSEEIIKSRWLIACDGAHSTVRHHCNLEFIGAEYHQNWWLADLLIHWDQPQDQMVIYPSKYGPLACFPMGDKRYRLVLTAPPDDNRDPELSDIEAAFHERAKDDAVLSDPVWITKFYIHHRQIQTYRHGRIFFAGDAAHIHSPMGGQGLNTGLQDVYNLVWKLALVQKKQAKSWILDSYHLERYPVGHQVLKDTDKMTRMILLKNPLLIKIRNVFMSFLLSFAFVRHSLASKIAELKISYAKSPIVSDLGHNHHLKAGTFLIDFNLTSLHDRSVQSLSEIVQGTKHHLFIFVGQAGHPESHLVETAKRIKSNFADLIDVHLVVNQSIDVVNDNIWLDEERVQEVKKIERPTVVLLRPDKYIGYTQAPVVEDNLVAYLETMFNKS